MSTRGRGSQRPYARLARVNALLAEVLADELERRADADERLRLLTVTAVQCQPDLRHAAVLLASLPAEAAEALEECRRALQSAVAAQIRMKRIPVLAFHADPAIAAGERVEEVLRRLHRGPEAASD